ncbi:MAG TPA: methyltransferase domain-containing protein [Pyrinomonadaceae bacterium]|nr:methyltransferase domain-containing protein [Pyrinomonadaceae bacterium]
MFEEFRQRSHDLERLDTGDYTRKEYDRWQREMRWIHGILGEKVALRKTLVKDIRERKLNYASILDIGAGTGNILKLVREMLPNTDLFSIAAETSDDALRIVKKERKKTKIQPLKCSGLRLPFADHSVDFVICTLLLHHLSDEDAVELIREMCRVSLRRFYIVDLNRHPFGYYGFKALGSLLFQRFTREDGALSILRSFTADEMLAMAKKAGVSEVKVEHSRANRLVLSGR